MTDRLALTPLDSTRTPRLSAGLMLALLLSPAAALAQTPPRIVADVAGSQAAERLGQSVAAIGDVDGDGRPDFAIGCPGWGPATADSTGRVVLYLGGRTIHDAPDLVLTGFQRSALFGFVVAGVGDVNGDGYSDFLVTAPATNIGDPARNGQGRVFLYLGGFPLARTPAVVYDPPALPFSGGRPRFFGSGAVGLGDANDDGHDDWAVGFDSAPSLIGGGALTYAGGTSLPTGYLRLCNGNGVGRPVLAAARNFSGDGHPDLIMGQPLPRSGGVFVTVFTDLGQSGSATSGFASVSSQVTGFGSAVVSPGDLNGDGLGDVLIGVPVAGGGGQVRAWYGNRIRPYRNDGGDLLPIGSGVLADSFGCSLAVGKLDGTGAVDLVVGACGDHLAGAGAGAAYFYRLAGPNPPSPLGRLVGTPGDGLGLRLANLGDLDGDGEDDLLLGTPARSTAAPGAGGSVIASFSPHVLVDPDGANEWPAGGTAHVHWRGAAPARLELTIDGGASWTTLLDGAGGAPENDVAVAVPDTVSGRCRVRISQSGMPADALHTDASLGSFAIVRPARAFRAAGTRAVARGPAAGEGRLGAALASGDFGGVRAHAIGAPLADAAGNNAGSVWIERGADPPLRLDGERGGEQFGAALALGGDIDHDGRGDLLVGAPLRTGAAGAAGGVSLFLGGAANPAVRIEGTQPEEACGAAVCWIGDWNGDGFDDFAVASPWFVPPTPHHGVGRVRIVFGGPVPHVASDLEFDAPDGRASFGAALAGIDLDGDGFADLAVSATESPNGPGEVFVYFGGVHPDTVPRLRLRGSAIGDRFGAALADGGDLNGDGIHDLLVGSPGASGAHGASGSVAEFIGGSLPGTSPAHVFDGDTDGEEFGAALAGVGDVNGDGRDDFAVGAPLAAGGSGAARVFFGGSDTSADGAWAGVQPGERFGAALASGDGATILAGAPLDEGATGATGRVDRLTATRYAIDEPASGARWFSGSAHTIRWRGGEPATLELSLDAGRTWRELAHGAVADPAGAFALTAPGTVTDSARVRIRPTDPGVPGRSEAAFAITRTTHVARFDFDLESDGIHLGWETEPAIGPDAWRAWRIYRLASPPELVSPDSLTASSLVVRDFERGGTYALRGVDGNGDEIELATLTVPAPATRLAAWPVPSFERGAVNLSVFPPVDGAGWTATDFSLQVYDVNGRLVRTIAGGRAPTRVGEIRGRWDRRTTRGDAARAGVYFLRAESPSRGFRLERRIVLLE